MFRAVHPPTLSSPPTGVKGIAYMTYYTSGGAGGMARFLDAFGPGHERRWRDLGDPALTPDLKAKIVAQTEEVVDGRAPGQIAAEQDEKLLRLLHVLGC